MVFFCGAGVSMPAGFPSFFQLTTRVMAKLGVAPSSSIGVAMADAIRHNKPELAPPLDQVFGMLQREFSRTTVEHEVREALKTPRGACAQNHEALLKISVDASGEPFVVTTNFDRMFEKIDARIKRWVGPQLPLMALDETPTGIVYLHGRLPKNSDEASGLVLSSSDFGRAYLADGWATDFMRDLLDRRVVVLLGYSANDPPIRYLLEGLSTNSSSSSRRIYAFAQGQPGEVKARWSELGISGIAFSGYSQLWSSLHAWAKRSSDKSAWQAHVLSLSRKSPRQLIPHERGQVAALVATAEGAKAFAESTPPPPAEWLCVFDKLARYAPVSKAYGQVRPDSVDPHAEYGLDDDPPRVVGGNQNEVQDGLDVLGTLPSDAPDNPYTRISNLRSAIAPIGTRLSWLVRWFERVLHEPSSLWWAARQAQLHPSMMDAIAQRLSNRSVGMTELDVSVRHAWSLLNESQLSSAQGSMGLRWVRLAIRIRAEGWTGAVIRELQAIAQPYVVARPATFRSPLPPNDPSAISISMLVTFDVKTESRRGSDIEVPNDQVGAVVRIMRGVLETAASLLSDVEGASRFYRAPAIEPTSAGDARFRHIDSLDADFLWFAELCGRLRELAPNELRWEVNAWPASEGFFFGRLRLHFWKHRDIFDGATVGEQLSALIDDVFWNPYAQRELLHCLKARWKDFSQTQRLRIERRLLRGRPRNADETRRDSARDRRYRAGVALGWLQRNGCKLSTATLTALTRIRGSTDWPSEHEIGADHDWEGRGGWVQQRTDPEELRDLPNSMIAERALELSGAPRDGLVQIRPFSGLVAERPVKALLALTIERRRSNYPESLWREFISSWPEQTSRRLLLVSARRLGQLPSEIVFPLRYEVTRWIEQTAKQLYHASADEFWKLWDALFVCLCDIGEAATGSSISSATNSKGEPRPLKTVDHAINGPIGHLVNAIFNAISGQKFEENEGLSPPIQSRLHRALQAPGAGAWHAAILLGRQLNFLYFADRRWFNRAILPHLSVEDGLAESFWVGIIHEIALPRPSRLFRSVKNDFLQVASEPAVFQLDEHADRNVAQMLIQAAFLNVTTGGFITLAECRNALRGCGDSGRNAALWLVEQVVHDDGNWLKFGKRFFRDAWPREVACRSSSTSEAMVRLATHSKESFAEIVATVSEYLTFVEYPDMVIHGLMDEKEGETIARRWPEETLLVLSKTVRLEATRAPSRLEATLEEVARGNEGLRTRKAWRDLSNLIGR
ncbi:SIR2-like domain-containing protein [Pararobbsia alpina]